MVKNSKPGGPPKTPSATIDLKAREVKTEIDKKKSVTADKPAKDKKTDKSAQDKPVQGKVDQVKAGQDKSAPKAGTDKAADKTTPSPSKNEKASDQKTKAAGRIKAEPKPAPKRAEKTRSGGGFFSNMLSAIFGGVIALFGMSYAGGPDKLMKMTGLPSLSEMGGSTAGSGLSPAVQQRLEQIEQRVSNASRGQDEVSSLKKQLQVLAERQNEYASTPSAPSVDPSEISTISDKVTSLESAMESLSNAAKKGGKGAVGQAALIGFEVKKAEQRLNAKLAKAVQSGSNSGEKIASLATQTTQMMEGQAGLQEKLAKLTEEQSQARKKLAEVRDQLAKLQTLSVELKDKVEQGPDLTKALEPFRSEIQSMQQNQQQARMEGRNLALSIQLNKLKQAMAGGKPFTSELSAITPQLPQGLDASPLQEFAETGLPTIADLHDALKKDIPAILKTQKKPEEKDSGWQSKIFSKLQSFGKVRKLDLEGSSVEAIVSRMEGRLVKGKNLRAAVEEAKSLNGEAAKAAQNWLLQANKKLKSESVITSLEEKMLKALGGAATQ